MTDPPFHPNSHANQPFAPAALSAYIRTIIFSLPSPHILEVFRHITCIAPDQNQNHARQTQETHLLDFQDVGAVGHVVEAGADFRETHEDEEASHGIGDDVCGSVLEVRRVVRTWFRSDHGVTHAESARRADKDWGHGKRS